jgi:signal transduction histidine kinase
VAINLLAGPASWLIVAGIIGLGIVNMIVLVWLFLHSPQHRWPVALILIGQISGRLIYAFDRALVIPTTLPVDVLLVGYTALIYTIALFAFRLFDPIALARQTVMEQLSDGILVLDLQGRVASLNTTAQRFFEAPANHLKGQPILTLLPEWSEEIMSAPDGADIEIDLTSGAETRRCSLAVSLLKDWRGSGVGRLLLLHDVTELRRYQAQLLEQQRALTVLKERERLGDELHGELAQELAMINVQAQLISGLLERGQEVQAREQLQALAGVARRAQVDVRREIGKLHHRLDPADGFLHTLRHLIEAFGASCGILIDLALPDDLFAISLAPTAEVQLLRIVQEALANIRKHAGAKQVRVSLTREPDSMLLRIGDDGVGFDPLRLPHSHESFGLGIMSQRAAEVGGRLDVESAPGRGTHMFITIPLKEEAI